MRSVWLGSLRTHARRYVSAAVAVIIGVAFVVVTGALSAAAQKSLAADLDAPLRWADRVVDRPAPDTVLKLMRTGEAWPIAWSTRPLRKGGRVVLPTADIGVVATGKRQQWQHLTSGRFPHAPGEMLVDTNTAKAKRIRLGDTLTLGNAGTTLTATVVGLATSPSVMAQSPAYVTWPDFQRWTDQFSTIAVGVSDRASLPAGVTAMTVPKWAKQVRADLDNQVDVITIMLVGFAVIALFVSVLVIANTFSILFAQRLRELALLRAVGATRRQLRRSLRWEALLLGVLSSLVGIVVGIGLGFGLVELVGLVYKTVPLAPTMPGAPWLAGGFAVGVLVTVVASLLPTRRVLTVSPLAALRPQESVEVSSRAGRARVVTGCALVAVGAVVLGLAMARLHGFLEDHDDPVMILGGAAVFVGVLVLGPVLVPALIRALGFALGALGGPSLRLASANAVRHPRRTAATAASLLVGVTLTTAVLTGMASVRHTLGEKLDEQYSIDVAVTSTRPLAGDIERDAERVQGVAQAEAIPGARGILDGTPITLLAPDRVTVTHRDLTPKPGTIRVNWVRADNLPDHVTVMVGSHRTRLRVVSGDGWGSAALVNPETLASLGAQRGAAYALWVRATKGTDPDDLGGDLGALAPHADITNGLSGRAYVTLQLDVFTGVVVGLLGIAVVIAIIGIANTLGLSVVERGREHALLRALGLTRRQLRRMLAAEAVLLTVVATVLGTGMGIGFAWAAYEVVIAPIFDDSRLTLPGGQLAVIVVVAALAGLLSAVVPARRASTVSPAAGLALD